MATTGTTIPAPVSPMDVILTRLNRYRTEGIAKGTYLAAPTQELVWYTVAATKASYLVDAADLPPPSEKEDQAARPQPAELVMILKVFHSEIFPCHSSC